MQCCPASWCSVRRRLIPSFPRLLFVAGFIFWTILSVAIGAVGICYTQRGKKEQAMGTQKDGRLVPALLVASISSEVLQM